MEESKTIHVPLSKGNGELHIPFEEKELVEKIIAVAKADNVEVICDEGFWSEDYSGFILSFVNVSKTQIKKYGNIMTYGKIC